MPNPLTVKHRNDFNHMVTSYSRGAKKSLNSPLELTLTRFLRGVEVRAFRKTHGLSAAGLASRLIKDPKTGATYSRPYVKRVESGGLRASPRFVRAFDELRAILVNEPVIEQRIIAAILYHKLSEDVREIEILARPVQCKGCHKWFVPITPNQKMHNIDSCKRAARKSKSKRRRGKR